MYKFIDVAEVPKGARLPSEALKINGEYIEDQIAGYQTLYVSGREMLAPELGIYETGGRDGSRLSDRRYPARTIVVGYQLVANSASGFREAYNKLGAILDAVDAELIFADEADKFFTGTPSGLGEIEPGRNSVTGEIEFTCLDPFKYSVKEYEVAPILADGTTFLVDYKGTYRSYPTLEANFFSESETSNNGESEWPLTGKGDCGYVAFFNDRGNIIQLGDPGEADGVDYAKSQTLANQSFIGQTSWGTAAKKIWKVNSGITSSDALVQTGSIGLAHSYSTTAANTYYLKAASYGSGSKYHGPSITRVLPADAAGHTGASNFTLTYKQKLSIGSGKSDSKQLGAFQVLLVSGSGSARRILAGVNVFKNKSGKRANLRFYVNGKTVKTMDIDLSYNNKYFGNNRAENKKKKITAITAVKTSSIKKSGQTIVFNIGGIKKSFTDSAIRDTEVREITFTFSKLSTHKELSFNGLYSAKFVKDNCDIWKDIPNKFSTDDVALADCSSGEVYLNDSPAPELGALGNDWEEFCLQPGLNQVGVSWSDWVADGSEPAFKMRYREVFL